MTKNDLNKRLVFNHTIIINALKENLFPLLCPVRESEWLPGFLAEIIYSDSGVAELDSTFLTHPGESNETVWVIPNYNKDSYIEMIYFQPKIMVVIIKLSLTDLPDNKTSLEVEYIYTSLSEAGKNELGQITEHSFENQIKSWEVALNYLFKNGSRIPMDLLVKHHYHTS